MEVFLLCISHFVSQCSFCNIKKQMPVFYSWISQVFAEQNGFLGAEQNGFLDQRPEAKLPVQEFSFK